MKTRIPKSVLPMIRRIRREVKRPRELPVILGVVGSGALRWRRGKHRYCPMGLHKEAVSEAPFYYGDFKEVVRRRWPSRYVISFALWWDRQRNAKAAVEAVWGKKKRHGR